MYFTSCKRVISKAYNGANGKKIAVEYAGKRYMLKFPPSGKNKPTKLSYTNSCFSEYKSGLHTGKLARGLNSLSTYRIIN